jgi:hypothetical protein
MKAAIQDIAMLISLNISQWTARKYDKNASSEVEKAHGANNAGRFNKMLIGKDALKDIATIATEARDFHYKMTLPWGDNGDRLLPASMFMDYRDRMTEYKQKFGSAVDRFVRDYPDYQTQARNRLGTMFNPLDYPPVEEVAQKFRIQTHVTPIPTAHDFRVQLNEDYVKEIRRDLRDRMEEQQTAAVRDCWTRLRERVERIYERLSDEDKVFRDSLIENTLELVEILPGLNITNDPELTQMATEVRTLLVEPERLRNEKALRNDIAAKADDILRRMPKWNP